jgi:hypothetical protein
MSHHHHLARARESMGPGSHIKVVRPRASLTNHMVYTRFAGVLQSTGREDKLVRE